MMVSVIRQGAETWRYVLVLGLFLDIPPFPFWTCKSVVGGIFMPTELSMCRYFVSFVFFPNYYALSWHSYFIVLPERIVYYQRLYNWFQLYSLCYYWRFSSFWNYCCWFFFGFYPFFLKHQNYKYKFTLFKRQ